MCRKCKNCKFRLDFEKNCSQPIMREIYFGVKIDENFKCDNHKFGN